MEDREPIKAIEILCPNKETTQPLILWQNSQESEIFLYAQRTMWSLFCFVLFIGTLYIENINNQHFSLGDMRMLLAGSGFIVSFIRVVILILIKVNKKKYYLEQENLGLMFLLVIMILVLGGILFIGSILHVVMLMIMAQYPDTRQIINHSLLQLGLGSGRNLVKNCLYAADCMNAALLFLTSVSVFRKHRSVLLLGWVVAVASWLLGDAYLTQLHQNIQLTPIDPKSFALSLELSLKTLRILAWIRMLAYIQSLTLYHNWGICRQIVIGLEKRLSPYAKHDNVFVGCVLLQLVAFYSPMLCLYIVNRSLNIEWARPCYVIIERWIGSFNSLFK
ncbi:hypothetical protein NEHOM01_0812 [Nematocida homosporus]|uniref:uncharacterized protein n=1 Tax=Nematocida homosporus TaxID=1912981 RepID=UPI00221ED68F|nr:uncharacterized protein NEHOM01_0812 [Nematocida homosporus]KAI5185397.1 hypothetical protein NEHOM01_0812 [Nematocida homosporus]